MKKMFKFAILALLVLPLVCSCKPNEPKPSPDQTSYDPEKPKEGIGSQAWFDCWFECKGLEEVDIKPANLAGIWQVRALTRKDEYVVSEDSINIVYSADYDTAYSDIQDYYFYDIKEDFTDTLYAMTKYRWGVRSGVTTLRNYPGEWRLNGKTLTINRQELVGIIDSSPEGTRVQYSIYRLTKDRMVWTYGENQYISFVRAEKPKDPNNPKITDILTSKKWKISYDHQQTTAFSPSVDPHDATGGVRDTIETKKNMWHDYQLEFKAEGADSTVIVYYPSGEKFEEFAWNLSTNSGDNILWLQIKFLGNDPTKLFSNYLSIEWTDFHNYNSATMWSYEGVDAPEGYEVADLQRWFEIKGVK